MRRGYPTKRWFRGLTDKNLRRCGLSADGPAAGMLFRFALGAAMIMFRVGILVGKPGAAPIRTITDRRALEAGEASTPSCSTRPAL